MKEKQIILRSVGSSTRDEAAGATDTLAVEVEEIDRKNIAAVARNADVVAVAPSMPMKLIEPVNVPGLAEPAAANATWGIKAVGADTSPFDGSGIVVCVLDTGIDKAHPAFAGVQIVEKDFTTSGNGDTHGHGTHCAGTIFGRDVNNTRIGVACGVQKALIGKVLGTGGGGSDQIVSAMNWAFENGANVISMSLGIDFPGYVNKLITADNFPPALATTRALEAYRLNVQIFERVAALIKATAPFRHPCTIIAAAGNESQRQVNPNFEIAVSPPAVADGFVSVAAMGEGTGAGFVVANFSNTGATLSGPGVNVLSAKRTGGLVAMSGTSMATPHVAGVAALWAQKLKTIQQLNLMNWTAQLIANCRTSGFAPFDPSDVGAGMVRAPQP